MVLYETTSVEFDIFQLQTIVESIVAVRWICQVTTFIFRFTIKLVVFAAWMFDWCAILIAHQLLWQNMEAPVSISQEPPLAGELARDCFTSTASTITNSVQNIFTRLRYCDKKNGCNL